jgi:erythromycin esterase
LLLHECRVFRNCHTSSLPQSHSQFIPIFALDLRTLPKDGPVAAWFAQPHRTRDIGAGFSDASASKHWTSDWGGPSGFDAILFVNTTTAARPN